MLVLLTAAMVLLAISLMLNRVLKKHASYASYRGLILGVVIFAMMNVFAWFAGKTVLFWSLFYHKTQIDNFAQYQIKNALLRELKGRARAILIGNSQTNASIDEVVMNELIGREVWSTELVQPGSRGFDMLTLIRTMSLMEDDLVICYLSEGYFYGGESGIVAADFFSLAEIPDLIELKGWELFPPGAAQSGLAAQIFPLYQFRKSFSHKVLGWDITNLQQRKFNQSLEENLETQARRRAPDLKFGKVSEFEQAAMSRAVQEMVSRGCTVIFIAGHMHPDVQRFMDQRLRPDMNRFLGRLKAEGKGRVFIVEGSELLHLQPADFKDLVHFTSDTQRRFTIELVNYLKRQFPEMFAPVQ